MIDNIVSSIKKLTEAGIALIALAIFLKMLTGVLGSEGLVDLA